MLEKLLGLLGNHVVIEHVNDFFAQGTYDDVWIPAISQDSRWIVITSDRAKGRSKGGKLPQLLKRNGIRHVVMSTTLHMKSGDEKVSILRSIWGQIEEVRHSQPGTRHDLRYRKTKNGNMIIQLMEVKAGKAKRVKPPKQDDSQK